MRNIELLAPARNAEIGKEAIRHGADAVYIGGPNFGARAAVGNSVEDIRGLCDYAHIFGARVYVTLNTILYDEEIPLVEHLIRELYEAGVDALITQDLAILTLDIPPIALHASTQMDNVCPEKAKLLERAGYSQIVLARELSLSQIRDIHNVTNLPLEAFVHGALCVSYSGRCYASEYCFGRSANRGRCAQFCRLSFDLIDANGQTIVEEKHLLSLRDMNRSAYLGEMMDAGVSSFKIEGRLKDTAYVKNITAYYRQTIDEILSRRKEYCRSSKGHTEFNFSPHPEKSFNRGFTDYFLHGRKSAMWNFSTPKSMGEFLGEVREVRRKSFVLHTSQQVNNGDGLVFIGSNGQLEGLRANRVEGTEIFPFKMPALRSGMRIYRNEDRIWENMMEKSTATRCLPLTLTLTEMDDGYTLSASLADEPHAEKSQIASIYFTTELQTATKPQRDNIIRNLSKMGGTPFVVCEVHIVTKGERFIPSSMITEMRRMLVDKTTLTLQQNHLKHRDSRRTAQEFSLAGEAFTYNANIANQQAKDYLLQHDARSVAPAFELQPPKEKEVAIMTCRHCLRYALGQCPRETGHRPTWKEPVSLRLSDGRLFPLRFDCTQCEMQVLTPKDNKKLP